MQWLEKLKLGLAKTSAKITEGIDNVINKRKLDETVAEELEDLLISADLGVEVSQHLVKKLVDKYRFHKEVGIDEIKHTLAQLIAEILKPIEHKELSFDRKPKILIVCGVNGGGKTTSIAKLANFYKLQKKSVMLVACDTFRAAAVDQLEVWANNLGITIIKGEENADPASVAYKGVKQAIDQNIDLVIIDTAGRLHNKDHLMAEMAKIIKTVQKLDESDTAEMVLVLDATTGQNALIQVEKFQSVTKLDSLIITKLDGTAKGGIMVAIAKKYHIPVLAIGVGEGIDDLQPFVSEKFAENLIGLK